MLLDFNFNKPQPEPIQPVKAQILDRPSFQPIAQIPNTLPVRTNKVEIKKIDPVIGTDYTSATSQPTQAQQSANSNIVNAFNPSNQSDLNAAYKTMYDDYARQTTVNNNRNIANSTRVAQQQAALAGYNPALGADYVSRSLGSAYDSNQQANLGLIRQKDELLARQTEENKQKQKEYIDLVSKVNPDFAAKLQSDYLTGAIGADYTSYLNGDGTVKQVSDFDRALATQVQEYMRVYGWDEATATQAALDKYRNESSKKQEEAAADLQQRSIANDKLNLESGDLRDVAAKIDVNGDYNPFGQMTPKEAADVLKKRGVINYASKNNARGGSMRDEVGTLVLWNNQPVKVISCERDPSSPWGVSYKTVLYNPITKQTITIKA